jgi:DNA-directed RNA polymerase subunit RPC12/RpoP
MGESPRAKAAEPMRGGSRLRCPSCKSPHLVIRDVKGITEHLAIFFTRRRKYRCEICGRVFRGSDRRSVPPPGDERRKSGIKAAPPEAAAAEPVAPAVSPVRESPDRNDGREPVPPETAD